MRKDPNDEQELSDRADPISGTRVSQKKKKLKNKRRCLIVQTVFGFLPGWIIVGWKPGPSFPRFL